jgi:cytoskeletal protein CcmA (bactofilin family)
MAKTRERNDMNGGPVISIIGPGMRVEGDCIAEGTIRIEGMVRGSVYAGKAVVIGKDGEVHGDISTHDAVISGQMHGVLLAASRLEVQSTARIEGEIRTRRLQLEEGAVVNGEVQMGEVSLQPPPTPGEDTEIRKENVWETSGALP